MKNHVNQLEVKLNSFKRKETKKDSCVRHYNLERTTHIICLNLSTQLKSKATES